MSCSGNKETRLPEDWFALMLAVSCGGLPE